MIITSIIVKVIKKSADLCLKSCLSYERDQIMLLKTRDGVPNEDVRWCRPTASSFQVKRVVVIEYITWNIAVNAEVMEIWKVYNHRYWSSDKSNLFNRHRMFSVDWYWLYSPQHSKPEEGRMIYLRISERKWCVEDILIQGNVLIFTSAAADTITTPLNIEVMWEKENFCLTKLLMQYFHVVK